MGSEWIQVMAVIASFCANQPAKGVSAQNSCRHDRLGCIKANAGLLGDAELIDACLENPKLRLPHPQVAKPAPTVVPIPSTPAPIVQPVPLPTPSEVGVSPTAEIRDVKPARSGHPKEK